MDTPEYNNNLNEDNESDFDDIEYYNYNHEHFQSNNWSEQTVCPYEDYDVEFGDNSYEDITINGDIENIYDVPNDFVNDYENDTMSGNIEDICDVPENENNTYQNYYLFDEDTYDVGAEKEKVYDIPELSDSHNNQDSEFNSKTSYDYYEYADGINVSEINSRNTSENVICDHDEACDENIEDSDSQYSNQVDVSNENTKDNGSNFIEEPNTNFIEENEEIKIYGNNSFETPYENYHHQIWEEYSEESRNVYENGSILYENYINQNEGNYDDPNGSMYENTRKYLGENYQNDELEGEMYHENGYYQHYQYYDENYFSIQNVNSVDDHSLDYDKYHNHTDKILEGNTKSEVWDDLDYNIGHQIQQNYSLEHLYLIENDSVEVLKEKKKNKQKDKKKKKKKGTHNNINKLFGVTLAKVEPEDNELKQRPSYLERNPFFNKTIRRQFRQAIGKVRQRNEKNRNIQRTFQEHVEAVIEMNNILKQEKENEMNKQVDRININTSKGKMNSEVYFSRIIEGEVVHFRSVETQTIKAQNINKCINTVLTCEDLQNIASNQSIQYTEDHLNNIENNFQVQYSVVDKPNEKESSGNFQSQEVPVINEDGHVVSRLLFADESDLILGILGEDIQCLAMSIGQFWKLEIDVWMCQSTCVVCFVKDFPKKAFFIKILELQTFDEILSLHISHHLKYKIFNDVFHTFLSSDMQYGFIFVDIEEGNYVGRVVEDKLIIMRAKRKANKKKNSQKLKNTMFGIRFITKLKKRFKSRNQQKIRLQEFSPKVDFNELMESLNETVVLDPSMCNEDVEDDLNSLPQASPSIVIDDLPNFFDETQFMDQNIFLLPPPHPELLTDFTDLDLYSLPHPSPSMIAGDMLPAKHPNIYDEIQYTEQNVLSLPPPPFEFLSELTHPRMSQIPPPPLAPPQSPPLAPHPSPPLPPPHFPQTQTPNVHFSTQQKLTQMKTHAPTLQQIHITSELPYQYPPTPPALLTPPAATPSRTQMPLAPIQPEVPALPLSHFGTPVEKRQSKPNPKEELLHSIRTGKTLRKTSITIGSRIRQLHISSPVERSLKKAIMTQDSFTRKMNERRNMTQFSSDENSDSSDGWSDDGDDDPEEWKRVNQ